MSQKNQISIKVAGAAGQGVESGGQGLAKALRRGGLHIFGVSDYMSLIKGGHNFFQITVSDEPVYCNTEKIHILVSFDPQQVQDTVPHIRELHEGGIFILDEGAKVDPAMQAAIEEVGAICCPMPLVKLATEIGGSRIMMNTVALGAVAGIMQLPFEALDSVVRENFAKKSTELADKNSQVAKSGYDFALQNLVSKFKYSVKYDPAMGDKMLINGNEAIAFGSWAAGCRFISFYPMTPGTSVGEWFTKRNSKIGVVTKHTEDEIASICMAIGAAQVGVRSMTTTSGGGFCLMVEALGLAGMTEVGVVVVNAMRGGPSTGLPTRTEQADLLFAIHSSHGEFPKIVLTPGTIEQCYEAGIRAHNLAEKYQTPVIILTDQLLAAEVYDISPDKFEIPHIDRGKLLSKEQLDKLESNYLRYEFSADGISPRALQGHPKTVHAPATDEHDETGHITEDAANRIKMMDKRMQKLETARRDIKPPEFIGPENADLTMIVWGSTYGVAYETIELFNRNPSNKQKINALHFSELWPLPKDKIQQALSKVKFAVSVEQNYTSQLATLLRAELGYEMKKFINRYDGRPLTAEELCTQVQEIFAQSLITA
ncbi:MAG: 2-oxoacid:acceptor oxidoreductase subunit alpha [Candidatus Caenarcaniphilales bacterium]|nr:2-oxoacid:acceptor oxidoreductase subunit alpha [Candidatus Caenarcaniphilales bacterium]